MLVSCYNPADFDLFLHGSNAAFSTGLTLSPGSISAYLQIITLTNELLCLNFDIKQFDMDLSNFERKLESGPRCCLFLLVSS